MLQRVHLVLVETTHSGNLGASARAMKTMGFGHLRLVNPQCRIDAQARALSAGAEDVLNNARIFSCLDDAIADCEWVVGTSARHRHHQQALMTPKEASQGFITFLQQHPTAQVALVLGRERIGLTNDELLKCRHHLFIPANPDYLSLNLAMVVQILCYELRQAWQDEMEAHIDTPRFLYPVFPKSSELAYFFQQTEHLYRELGFIQNDGVMTKLQHLYQRAELNKAELGLLCGMLRAVQDKINRTNNN